MKKRALRKHTLKLGDGQIERIKELHPHLPYSEVVRRILDAYIDKASAQLGSNKTKIEVDIEV